MHPSSIVHSLVRFRDGAALAHLGYPDMTVPISFALTYPERAATEVPRLDLAGGLTLEFSAPDLETFPLLALARRAGELGGTYPCGLQRRERGRRRGLPRRPAAVPRDRGDRRGGDRGGGRRRSTRPRRADGGGRGRAPPRRARRARRMSIFVSILGLGFLILIHEAGHFLVARAVGMNPRKFYLGFPPALVKTKRNGIEYGIGAIPLGGYVKIPGMHRPAAGDLAVHFGRAVEEDPLLRRPVDELRAHLEESDYAGARDAIARLASQIEPARLSPVALKTVERGLGRNRRRPGARRLLACEDVEARRGHLRRPRLRTSCWRSLVHGARHCDRRLYCVGGEQGSTPARSTRRINADRPRLRCGLAAERPDRRRSTGAESTPTRSRPHPGSGGEPLRVHSRARRRDGSTSARSRREDSPVAYRLGFVLRGKGSGR